MQQRFGMLLWLLLLPASTDVFENGCAEMNEAADSSL
jgi:hypothetical protein